MVASSPLKVGLSLFQATDLLIDIHQLPLGLVHQLLISVRPTPVALHSLAA